VVHARGEPLPQFDFHCPLLSLPLAFGTRLATIPAAPHYLSAPSDLVKAWDAKLRPDGRPRVGIAWSGNPAHKYDHERSISLSAVLPLLDLPIQVVSLQRDVSPQDKVMLNAHAADIAHFGLQHTDFLETAALASLMDVVVSVDTAIAHLACALGRPTWILLAFVPDWRWMLDREDSPWYPTARLFRQRRPDDWDEVIARVAAALADRIARREDGAERPAQ